MADENPTDQGAADRLAPRRKQEFRDQAVVLMLVLSNYPTHLRLSELVREFTDDSDDFRERDRVERAVRELVSAGLLFRCESLVLPTRAALWFEYILTV
jgi:hypothetical protein